MADVSFAEWKKENVEIRKSRTFHYDYNKNNERITIKRDFRRGRGKELQLDQTEQRPINFLKYYMIASYSYCRKNNISKDVFELLLFLYSEPPMSKQEIQEYCRLLPKKTQGLAYLIKKDLVKEVLPLKEYCDAPLKFYQLSYHVLKSIHNFYLKLLKMLNNVGRGDINPVFWKNPMSVLDKRYRKALIDMQANDSDNFNNYKMI